MSSDPSSDQKLSDFSLSAESPSPGQPPAPPPQSPEPEAPALSEELTRAALELGLTEEDLGTLGPDRVQTFLSAADRRGFEAFRQQFQQQEMPPQPPQPMLPPQQQWPQATTPWVQPPQQWQSPAMDPGYLQQQPWMQPQQPQPAQPPQPVKFEVDAEAYGLPPELTKQLQSAYDQQNQQLQALQQSLQQQQYMLQLQQQQAAEASAREYAGWFDKKLSSADDLKAVVGKGDYWQLPANSPEARQRERLLEEFQIFAQYKGRDPFSRDDELLSQFLSTFVRHDPTTQQKELSDKLKAASRKTISRPQSRHPDGRFASAAEKDPQTGMPLSGMDKIDEFLYASRGF